jgi:hypothetical protein
MRVLALSALALVLLACSSEQQVYRPHFTEQEISKAKEPPPKSSIPEGAKPIRTEDVKSVNLSDFGLDTVPGSLATGPNTRFFYANSLPTKIVATYEANVDARQVAEFYKTRIVATHGYASGSRDFGSLDGTTKSGYEVQITASTVDAKTTITYTIIENKKK